MSRSWGQKMAIAAAKMRSSCCPSSCSNFSFPVEVMWTSKWRISSISQGELMSAQLFWVAFTKLVTRIGRLQPWVNQPLWGSFGFGYALAVIADHAMEDGVAHFSHLELASIADRGYLFDGHIGLGPLGDADFHELFVECGDTEDEGEGFDVVDLGTGELGALMLGWPGLA